MRKAVYLGMVLFCFRFNVCLIHSSIPLNVRESIHQKSVFGIEWVTMHRVQSEGGVISIFEFDEDISTRDINCLQGFLLHMELWPHPLLFPVASSQGTEISSGLIGAPFFANSFAILAKSFSSFDLSMTGTPSTTRIVSKPSSYWTWYLSTAGN